VSDWKYSTAERCPRCNMRVLIPNEETADRFVARSEGWLEKSPCQFEAGAWHLDLNYSAVMRLSLPEE
jgi:hypothetical protein